MDLNKKFYDPYGKRIAFEGAQGFGAYSKGGRGGQVYYVTSLESDKKKEGTLRYGIDKKTRPLTILFKVSGNIDMEGDVHKIENGRLTIDGSTAPGKGVCLINGGLQIQDARHVIIRYIRIRPKIVNDKDSLSISGTCKHIMIDHCSCSWASDEILSVFADCANRVTIQWCYIYEAFGDVNYEHRFGSLLVPGAGGKVSFLCNLYAHNDSRNPRTGNKDDATDTCRLDFRNNVTYNWGNTAVYNGQSEDTPSRLNFVNNVFLSGSDSKKKDIIFQEKGSKQSRGYFEGNALDGKTADDPYDLVQFKNWDEADIEQYKQTKEFDLRWANTTTIKTKHVLERVLEHGGCNLPKRDDADKRIVLDIEKRRGTIVQDRTIYDWPSLE